MAHRCAYQRGFQVAADGEGATVEGIGARPVTLPHVRSASGARYSDGGTTYWSRGSEALLEIAGEEPRVCSAVAGPLLLSRTRWRLVVESSEDRVAVPDDPAKYTLELAADGALWGRADCNRFRGRWSASGSSSRSLPSPRTRALCPPSSLFDRYLGSLEAAASLRFERLP